MVDRNPDRDDGRDAHAGPAPVSGRGWFADTPRWVKVFGIIGLIIAVLFAAMLWTGHRGPSRHVSSPDAGTGPRAVTMAPVVAERV